MSTTEPPIENEFDGTSLVTWVDAPVAAYVGKLQAAPSFPFTITKRTASDEDDE